MPLLNGQLIKLIIGIHSKDGLLDATLFQVQL